MDRIINCERRITLSSRPYTRHIRRLAWLAPLLFLTGPASAVDQQKGDTANYTFTGILVAMTDCKINGEAQIEVPFGNVGIKKVESGVYMREIVYALDCANSIGSSNTLLMTLKATPVAGDASSIEAGAPGLWAQFYKDGSLLTLNQEFKIDDPMHPPKLEVKLVKDPGSDFVEGDFKATATLMAEYM